MRILGCDYGEKRIGLAISDPGGEMALVLRTETVRGPDDAVECVARAVGETEARAVVVGLPLNMDGSRGPMVEAVEAFAARLRARLGATPVETCDERLSTSQVERSLIAADVSRARRRMLRDKLAAQVILQGYLDRRASVRGPALEDGEAE